MSKYVLLPLCALLLLAGSASAAGVTFISSCPFTITQPGQYHLAQDLTCGGFAVIISSNDVEVHFDGHTLTGVGALIGIDALNVSNISIFGSGTITGFRNGIVFQGVTGGQYREHDRE
jgi:hypothetical protein